MKGPSFMPCKGPWSGPQPDGLWGDSCMANSEETVRTREQREKNEMEGTATQLYTSYMDNVSQYCAFSSRPRESAILHDCKLHYFLSGSGDSKYSQEIPLIIYNSGPKIGI